MEVDQSHPKTLIQHEAPFLTVLSCLGGSHGCPYHRPQSQTPPPVNKRAKKDKTAPAKVESYVQVITHDTVLFPEGGGQPYDIGTLTSADGELWDVVDVKRHGGHAVHYVRVSDRGVDAALKAFTSGSIVNVALGEAGLARRLDHMCVHTSQHLLSAVLDTRDLPTLSWSLTPYPAPCYVEIPRSMSVEEIASVQEQANKLVFEGRKVHIEVQELHEEVVQKYDGPSVGIPTDYTGGVQRTVIIDGVDRSHCCGTHLPSLSNLQLFIIPHTESLARASTTSARLYFLAGPRLITYLTSTHTFLSSTANILSCGAPNVPERVEQVVDDRKRATKRVEDLELELSATIAKNIIAAFQGKSKPIVLYKHRTDDAINALGFLSSISFAFVNEMASRAEPTPYLIVFSSSPSAQSAGSTTVVTVFGSDEKRVKEVGDVLKSKLNVKGGGKGPRWSGKFTGVWKENREGTVVEDALRL
ncbi:hypothetical protein NM688_g1435 [Phlebia brevispora]|uniref:Uncharacterized protein n=1 Tax=Phlebia brevispora TaxID=194682 RepID=A0ACC1TBA5_9APHY|nr:hypothetical protein NM688_g1435 [Phlebia brevispora]